MLNTQDLAYYLTQKLNDTASGKEIAYTFDILAETGGVRPGANIKGIMRSLPNEYVPVRGYTEVRYVYAVELIVPTARSNEHYIRVNEIVGETAQALQNMPVAFGDGQAVLTFTMGTPAKYEIRYGAGESTPIVFTVRATYTDGATVSANKHWSLDGNEIPFLKEGVSLEQDGIQRKIFTEEYTNTLLTGHTKYYTFRIPYESAFYKTLQTEILSSPRTVHTLSYYDGAAFTQEAPFTSEVIIFRTASSASEPPNASYFDVVFTDAYTQNGLQYFLALIDFPFDMNGEDTRYFTSQEEQQEYFEGKAAAGAPFVAIDAPNLDNLVITRQVYNGSASASQFDYASKNYAVLKVVDGSSTRYFYYFVENCAIGAHGQIVVDLKMDTVQTYFFDPSVTFSDCLIERAHLNRFVALNDTSVAFVSDPATKIFNSEEGLNFPKRLVKRTKLTLHSVTGTNVNIDTWLQLNVAYWVYIFISPNVNYTYGSFQGSGTVTTRLYGKVSYPIGFDAEPMVLCYPVYKNFRNDGSIGLEKGTDDTPVWVNLETKETEPVKSAILLNNHDNIKNVNMTIVMHQCSEFFFRFANNDASNFFSKKISMLPPFDVLGSDVEIDSNNNLVIYGTSGKLNFLSVLFGDDSFGIGISRFTGGSAIRATFTPDEGTEETTRGGLFITSTQTKKYVETNNYTLLQNASLSKSAIIAQQPPNPSYNPKLNGQNFKELKITTSSGDSFTYDIQKLCETYISFMYSEPIVPEITRYYFRVEGGTGLYEEQTDESYMGLVGSTDNGLAFINSQLAEFLANNRNFYAQSNLKIGAEAASGLLGGAVKLAAGDPGGAGQLMGATVNLGLNLINRSMTIDNMKNAPDQMKNANGNVILNLFATELGLYVEEYSALDGDLKTANDFMNLYGFTFSSVANVRDYVHIRKYHNFIKAQLQSISGNLSNVARGDLRTRFANGIRFWNSDTVSYQYENYELWLEE